MITEQQVLSIAESKVGVILYHDFDALEPAGSKGDHWLFQIKKILLDNKYICHEQRKKDTWGDCGYEGNYTHFHKPGYKSSPISGDKPLTSTTGKADNTTSIYVNGDKPLPASSNRR